MNSKGLCVCACSIESLIYWRAGILSLPRKFIGQQVQVLFRLKQIGTKVETNLIRITVKIFATFRVFILFVRTKFLRGATHSAKFTIALN